MSMTDTLLLVLVSHDVYIGLCALCRHTMKKVLLLYIPIAKGVQKVKLDYDFPGKGKIREAGFKCLNLE